MVQQPQQTSIPSTSREFISDGLPAFPSDLPTIELESISLAKLKAGDSEEQNRLFRICKVQGFFCLDFSGTNAASLPTEAEKVANISEDVFKLPMEEKGRIRLNILKGQTFGYKGAGWGRTDKKGTPDTVEFYNVSQDDMNPNINPTPQLSWPDNVLSQRAQLLNYCRTSHDTGMYIMSILAQKLNLPANAFDPYHRFNKTSGSHIRMTRGPPRKTPTLPEIQVPGHTDYGTITILFNWLGGLQIWSEAYRGNFVSVVDPDYDTDSTNKLDEKKPRWLWVKPKPGQAIVNLGDAAVKFTNGIFCSGRHRVVPAPGEQGLLPRYSVVYFVRPEDDAILKTLDSDMITKPEGVEEEWTAAEWIKRQFMQIQREKGTDAATAA